MEFDKQLNRSIGKVAFFLAFPFDVSGHNSHVITKVRYARADKIGITKNDAQYGLFR